MDEPGHVGVSRGSLGWLGSCPSWAEQRGSGRAVPGASFSPARLLHASSVAGRWGGNVFPQPFSEHFSAAFSSLNGSYF